MGHDAGRLGREEHRLVNLVPADSVVLVAGPAEDLEDLSTTRRAPRQPGDLEPVADDGGAPGAAGRRGRVSARAHCRPQARAPAMSRVEIMPIGRSPSTTIR